MLYKNPAPGMRDPKNLRSATFSKRSAPETDIDAATNRTISEHMRVKESARFFVKAPTA